MARILMPDELHERWSRARARSVACTERAVRLTQDACAARTWAVQVRLDSIELRERSAPVRDEVMIVSFVVQGLVEEARVEASYELGRLECPPELRERAEVLVAMGETFGRPGGRATVATLDGPVSAVLLTVMRAFSRIYVLEVGTRQAGAP
ncbi:MAG TPA: hypothetical protein VKB57_13705 [Acidimicrobiales bacterium]|nr:hypothetical protein [Acidimicrobiales bacterium]